jgi:hypothetical protein
MLSIQQTRRGSLSVPSFDHSQLDELANTAIAAEGARLAQAININDQPARELTDKYAKAKAKKGARPIRDLRLTGAMMGSRGILDTQDNSVTVGFHAQDQIAKAAINESREKMLGPSAADQIEVRDRAHEIFAQNIRRLNGK